MSSLTLVGMPIGRLGRHGLLMIGELVSLNVSGQCALVLEERKGPEDECAVNII